MAGPTDRKTSPQAEAKPKEPPERPEVAQFLKWKRTGVKIHWQLVDGSTVIGTLNWFDNYNVQLRTDMGDITLLKHAILWYRALSEL